MFYFAMELGPGAGHGLTCAFARNRTEAKLESRLDKAHSKDTRDGKKRKISSMKMLSECDDGI